MSTKRKSDDIPEITPEMVAAGEAAYYARERYRGDHPISDDDLTAIYRAMHAAAVAPTRSTVLRTATGKAGRSDYGPSMDTMEIRTPKE